MASGASVRLAGVVAVAISPLAAVMTVCAASEDMLWCAWLWRGKGIKCEIRANMKSR